MTRVFTFLLRNWPLKLAAVLLATLLYAGLVLSQNAREFPGSIPIVVRGEANDVVLLSNVGDVDRIRFTAPPTVRVDSSSFEATIDLTDIQPSPDPISVPVDVRAVDQRITILEVEPARIDVVLVRVETKTVKVVPLPGVVPPGLQINDPVADPANVEVRGPGPVLDRVLEVYAHIQIEPSGLDFDRDVELVPVDSLGEEVLSVQVTPATAKVSVDVFADNESRSLPVRPTVIGTPASGFEVAEVLVEPSVISVAGDAASLAALAAIDTEPIPVGGRTEDLQQSVALQLPEGVTAIGSPEVEVTVILRRVTETRTFGAGVVLEGARSDLTYALSTSSVLVVVGGSPADLDGLVGATIVVSADVSDLEPGLHIVPVTPTLAPGVSLVSVNPATVTITIAEPASTAPADSPVSTP